MTFKVAWSEVVLSIIHSLLDSKVSTGFFHGKSATRPVIILFAIELPVVFFLSFSAWSEWRSVHTIHCTARQPGSTIHKVCEVCQNYVNGPHQIQQPCEFVNLYHEWGFNTGWSSVCNFSLSLYNYIYIYINLFFQVTAPHKHSLSGCLTLNETFLKKSLQAALKRIAHTKWIALLLVLITIYRH